MKIERAIVFLILLTVVVNTYGDPKKEPVAPPFPLPPQELQPTPVPAVGSIWGHTHGAPTVSQSRVVSLYSDPVAHALGDLVTIVVDLQNTINKNQNTTTAKTTAVNTSINSLIYPNNGASKGYFFLNNQGVAPATSWNSAQSFNGGGAISNAETASTTIQAQIVEVEANGVFKLQAFRHSKAGSEDTSMVLVGYVRPDDISSSNSVSSSRLANLEIIQRGKGTITDNQRKGWLTKLYEFLTPF